MLELIFADIPSVGTTDNELQFDCCVFKCVLKYIMYLYHFKASVCPVQWSGGRC